MAEALLFELVIFLVFRPSNLDDGTSSLLLWLSLLVGLKLFFLPVTVWKL